MTTRIFTLDMADEDIGEDVDVTLTVDTVTRKVSLIGPWSYPPAFGTLNNDNTVTWDESKNDDLSDQVNDCLAYESKNGGL